MVPKRTGARYCSNRKSAIGELLGSGREASGAICLRAPPRSRPPALARRSSSRAEQRTPPWRDFASAESVSCWWTRGHTAQRGTFSPIFVAGQKPYPILGSGGPVLAAIPRGFSRMAGDYPFRPGERHSTSKGILRGMRTCSGLLQGLPVVPRHPCGCILS